MNEKEYEQELTELHGAKTPESIKPHAQDYKSQAWKRYSIFELGTWVHNLVKRASHRSNIVKAKKDLYDAQNYLNMMQSCVNDAKTKIGENS